MALQDRIDQYVPLNELEQVLKYLFLNNLSPDRIDYSSRAFQKTLKPEKNMTREETVEKFRRIMTHIADNSYLSTDMFIPEGRALYIRKFPRYMADALHYHKDALEINVVLQGEFMQRINGSILRMSAGDVCFVAPNVRHGTRAFDDSTVVLSVMVYQEEIRRQTERLSLQDSPLLRFLTRILYGKEYYPYLICRTEFDRDLMGMVIDMEEIQDEDSPYINQYMETGLSLFILRMLMMYQDRIILGSNVQKNDSDILNLEDYIEANYQTVTLNSLARTYNYSPSYLSGLIREQYGRSFSDIMTEIRMKHAVRLLQTTDDSMAKIAEAVGYSDKSYFLRRFKQVFKMTPSQYKEQRERSGPEP